MADDFESFFSEDPFLGDDALGHSASRDLRRRMGLPGAGRRPEPRRIGAVLDPLVGSLVRRAREGTPHAYGMTPLAFPSVRLPPMCGQYFTVQPQVPFAGPYRFAFSQVDGVHVNSLNVGNVSLLPSPGATLLSLWNFDAPAPAPAGLTPIHGPVCNIGCRFTLCVENKGREPVDFSATLWGYTFESLALRGEKPDALAAVQRLILGEREGAQPGDLLVFTGQRWERARELERALATPRKGVAGVSGSPDVAAAASCLPSPPAGERSLAPVKQITAQEYIWQQRRDADRAASADYAEAHPPPPRLEPEPEKEWWQEQWSTANDES